MNKRDSVWVALVGLLLAVALVAGCKGKAADASAGPKAVAIDFYKSFILAHDRAHAWDITTDEWRSKRTGTTKEDYLKVLGDAKPRPLGSYEVEEIKRVDDRLYLVSDTNGRYLIWVTQTPDGWRVRRHEYYKGGEIPWR